MSRFRSRNLLRWGTLAVLGVCAVAGLSVYGKWLLSIDPFARYRPQEQADPERDSLVYRNVEFAMFDESRQIGTCLANELRVARDRQTFDIVGVSDGKMSAEDGSFEFEARTATYLRRTQVISALDGARVWTKDWDLSADGFSYYERAKTLQTLGKTKGKFFGGDLVAYNFRYNTVDKSGSTGAISWKGSLAKFAKGEPGLQTTSRPWDIKGSKMSIVGDEWIFTDARATDGDVILTAEKVAHNKKNDVVTATGKVKYFSSKSNMTCEKAVIYRKEKRAVLTGNVTMLVKPREQEKLEEAEIPPFRPAVPESIAAGRPPAPVPGEKAQDEEVRKNNLRKYPTQIWADRIEYWYQRGTRRAVATGTPQARQDLPAGRWRHVWTFIAKFDVEADKLRLESAEGKKNVRLITSIGDDLLAKWLQVSTKEGGQDEMEGEDVEGTVISDDDDVNNRNSKPPPTTGGGLKGAIGA